MYSDKRSERIYDGKKNARLGTVRNPATVTVKTKKRAKELESIFKKNGWEHSIEVRRGEPEDIADLESLQNPVVTERVEKKPGRNDPCPCGSGKKYKKCCGSG